MRKLIKIIVPCLVAAVIVLGGLIGGAAVYSDVGIGAAGQNYAATPVRAEMAPSRAGVSAAVEYDEDGATADAPFTPITTGRTASSDVNDGKPIYTMNDTKIGYIRGSNVVIDENGCPVYNPLDSGVILYDAQKKEFFDSALKTLSIYEDSKFLDKQFLRSGDKKVTPILANRSVFIVNLKVPGQNAREIYCFRDEIKYNIFEIIFIRGKDKYRYSDMNGWAIDSKYLRNVDQTLLNVLGYAALLVNPILGIIGGAVIDNIPNIPVRSKGTLKSLFEEISILTVKPDQIEFDEEGFPINFPDVPPHLWATIIDNETGWPFLTRDGYMVYINPRNMQLCSYDMNPIFTVIDDVEQPIYVSPEGYLLCYTGQEQLFLKGVLMQCYSVQAYIKDGIEFYLTTTSDARFTVPCSYNKNTKKFETLGHKPLPDFVEKPTHYTEILSKEDLDATLASVETFTKDVVKGMEAIAKKMAEGAGKGAAGFMEWIGIVVMIIVVLLIGGILVWFGSLVFGLFKSAGRRIKK